MNFQDWIKTNWCFINVKVKDRQELFQIMNQQFLAQDLVNSTYLASLIEREKNYPTGLKMGSNLSIAIPHTDPEHIKVNCVVVVLLKTPVEFIHMATTDQTIKVRLCFFILSKQGHMQIDLLNQILVLAQNQETMKKLISSTSKNELYENLMKALKEEKMKKIIVACGSGVATSQLVASKIKHSLEEQGYNAEVEAVDIKSLETQIHSADAFVSIVNVGVEVPIPTFNGIAFLTGQGQEEELDKIIEFLGK